MRFWRSFLVVMSALLAAGSAGALVTINHLTTGSTLVIPGEVFTIQVRLSWDGQGALQGVSTSTTFNSTLIEFVSSTTARASVLNYTDNTDPNNPVVIPGLARLTTQIQRPGDPAGILRTVQYLGSAPADPRAATIGQLVTTLTFRWIGGPGVASIGSLIADGDDGVVGDSYGYGSFATVIFLPEPGTALLVGLGLAALSRRRN
jgi:hypothetical protein